VLFLAALVVLYREFSAYGYQEMVGELGSLPAGALVAAVALTVGVFVVLFAGESLALRYVGRPLGAGPVALVAFLAHAFDQVLGSPLLTGAPVRDRLYSAWDLSTDEIGRLVAFGTATSWVGLLGVVGGALLLLSTGPAAGLPIPVWALRAVGVASLGVVLGYVAWTLLARHPLRVLSWELPSPSPGLATVQLATGVVRWLVAAGVLYVLLPSGHGLPLSRFVGAFALALVLGRISQVPAGLGVFEASLVALLPDPVVDGSLAASLVAYRAVHHLLPAVLAAAGLALHELRRRRELVERTVDTLGRGVSSVVPVILATLVFVAGAFLLATGALPVPEGRVAWLGRALPLFLVELSHFLGSLVGAGLLILAWGLRQRSDAAYRLTLVLLGVGAVLSVGRGFGSIEAVGLVMTLAVLLPARGEFFRKASATAALPSVPWAVLVGITLAGTVWLGLFVYRRVDLTAELWWEFALRGDAPRFLRATVGVGVLLLGYGLWRLLRPATPGAEVGVGEEIPPEVDAVVEASSRAHAALVYLDDKRVLLSESRRALVMYAIEGRSWIALGDPLGDPEDFDELIWRFRQAAHRHGGWPVFYQARPDALPLYADVGLGAVKLGEEAYVPLDGFTLEGPGRKGLRRTVRRVEEEGAAFEILARDEVGRALPELRRVSDAWLEEKKAREKGFSLGFFTENYLLRTPVAVLRHDDEIVAFANVLAGGTREELSADLMRYRPGAPASSMEYLFLRLMLWGAAEGYGRFSLGMAPLSGLEAGPLAPLWNRVGAAVFRYGEHFYNFRGLRAYKEKFDPAWEPRYLVTPGGLAFPRILANLAALVGGGVRGMLRR
ncbi:MAG: bifunctional lysylphosphatidylglycerol flippase/synthetase MprF, partial [Gemmatimonadota bacterium]